jgi:photosystem II stability/assembly factor-like uncharacterized protein
MAHRATLGTVGESLRSGHRLVALALLVAPLVALGPPPAQAHDPDVYGGLFRTHDAGANWVLITPGFFASGALALAASPLDPNHLLLGTDSGAWRSRNGGRDWEVEAPDILAGPAFAVAFAVGGDRALLAGATALFRHDGERWRPISMPSGTAPARALVAGSAPGRVYLAGRSGLYRSDDWGRSWISVGAALRAEHVDQVVVRGGRDDVHAVAGGTLWSSGDAGRTWRPRGGSVAGGIEAIGFDPSDPASVWAAAGGRILHSHRPDEPWRTVGTALPETPARAHALAISGTTILVATDRGLFRSSDGGNRWDPPREGLPAHLIAGVLAPDPRRPATLFAGFAPKSYEELRQQLSKPGAGAAASAPTYGSTVLVLAGLLACGLVAGVLGLSRARSAARAGRPSVGGVQQ